MVGERSSFSLFRLAIAIAKAAEPLCEKIAASSVASSPSMHTYVPAPPSKRRQKAPVPVITTRTGACKNKLACGATLLAAMVKTIQRPPQRKRQHVPCPVTRARVENYSGCPRPHSLPWVAPRRFTPPSAVHLLPRFSSHSQRQGLSVDALAV